MPKASSRTFASGARQFVVHDAFEMMKCRAGSNWSSLTPMTNVASGSSAGAEMTTRVAPGLEMLGRLFALGVLARRLDDDIDAELLPRQRLRLRFGEHLDAALTDDHRVALDAHRFGIAPVDRVPSEESGKRLGSAEVVDRNDLELRVQARARLAAVTVLCVRTR